MNGYTALKELYSGERIKRKSWDTGVYLEYNPKTERIYDHNNLIALDEKGKGGLSPLDLPAPGDTDWMVDYTYGGLIEQPKSGEFYAFANIDGNYVGNDLISVFLYADEISAYQHRDELKDLGVDTDNWQLIKARLEL